MFDVSRRRSIVCIPVTTSFTLSVRGCTIALRVNVSSWRVSAEARFAAVAISSIICAIRIIPIAREQHTRIRCGDRENVVEIVCDAARQRADGLHLLRLAQLLLEQLSLREI